MRKWWRCDENVIKLKKLIEWECIKKSYIYDGFTHTVVSFALELHEKS